jgi:hypothetical protein
MPAARHHSQTLSRVRDYAYAAQRQQHGLELYFWTREFGSLEAANVEARSFQTLFSALRAKERRKAMFNNERKDRQERDYNFNGPLDDLTCFKRPLPNGEGFKVQLMRNIDVFAKIEVRAIGTGELVPEFNDAQLKRVTELFDAIVLAREIIPRVWPLSAEDTNFLRELNPEAFTQLETGFSDVPKAGEEPNAADLHNLTLDDVDGAQSEPALQLRGALDGLAERAMEDDGFDPFA